MYQLSPQSTNSFPHTVGLSVGKPTLLLPRPQTPSQTMGSALRYSPLMKQFIIRLMSSLMFHLVSFRYEMRQANNSNYVFNLANRAYFDETVLLRPCVQDILQSELRSLDFSKVSQREDFFFWHNLGFIFMISCFWITF